MCDKSLVIVVVPWSLTRGFWFGSGNPIVTVRRPNERSKAVYGPFVVFRLLVEIFSAPKLFHFSIRLSWTYNYGIVGYLMSRMGNRMMAFKSYSRGVKGNFPDKKTNSATIGVF